MSRQSARRKRQTQQKERVLIIIIIIIIIIIVIIIIKLLKTIAHEAGVWTWRHRSCADLVFGIFEVAEGIESFESLRHATVQATQVHMRGTRSRAKTEQRLGRGAAPY